MKKAKKVLALIMASTMILGLALTANAAQSLVVHCRTTSCQAYISSSKLAGKLCVYCVENNKANSVYTFDCPYCGDHFYSCSSGHVQSY